MTGSSGTQPLGRTQSSVSQPLPALWSCGAGGSWGWLPVVWKATSELKPLERRRMKRRRKQRETFNTGQAERAFI